MKTKKKFENVVQLNSLIVKWQLYYKFQKM